MIVRELLTKIGFKTDLSSVTKFEDGVKSAKRTILAFTAAISVSSLAIFGFVESAARAGDELDKTKDVLGLTIRQIQILKGVAGLAGIQSDEFSMSMRFFAKAVGGARQGLVQYSQAFQMLGIGAADLRMNNQYELLLKVADGFKGLKNQQDQAIIAQELFSRSGGKMINMINEGSKGIADASERVKKYAFILDKDAVAQSAEFQNKLGLLKMAIIGIKNAIGIALMPAVEKIIKAMLDWIAVNKKVFANNVANFFKIMGKVAKDVGLAISAIIGSLELMGRIISDLTGNKLSPFKAVLFGILGILALINAQFIIIAAVIGGIVLIMDDINSYLKGQDSLIGRFLNKHIILHDILKGIGETIKIIGEIIKISLIDPIEFLIKMLEHVYSIFKAISSSKLLSSITGIISSVGIGGINPMQQMQTFHNVLQRNVATTTNRNITTANKNITANTNVNVTVPSGTTDQQQTFLKQTAQKTFEEHFTDKLKHVLVSLPLVEV